MAYENGKIIQLLVVAHKNERGLPIGHVLAVDPDDQRMRGLEKLLRAITMVLKPGPFGTFVCWDWPKEGEG